MRTSRVTIYLRYVAFGWVMLWLFFHTVPLTGRNYATTWSTWWFPLLLSFFIVTPILMWFAIVDWLVYSVYDPNDPTYAERKRHGWNAFWDQVPAPFNNDSELTRQFGQPEPKYTGFVPPPEWNKFQCPQCGARVESGYGACWNCPYGHKTPDIDVPVNTTF